MIIRYTSGLGITDTEDIHTYTDVDIDILMMTDDGECKYYL